MGIEADCAFGVPAGWVSAAELGFLPPLDSSRSKSEANGSKGEAANASGATGNEGKESKEEVPLLGRNGRGQRTHVMRPGGEDDAELSGQQRNLNPEMKVS
jgi:hypothetical protein